MRYLLPLILCIIAMKPELKSQCIQDVRFVIDSPYPCFFIGMVNMEQPACFDPSQPQWKYRWQIRSAESGEVLVNYQGFAFAHHFTKFGGYDFCLEIDKDGDPITPPEVSECVRYTTCEFCKDAPIEVNYLDCTLGQGCNVELSATIPAENSIGLKPYAHYVVTYHPTSNEALGGGQPYDIIFDKIPITFLPSDGVITVKDNVSIPYSRGCYKTRLVLELEWGAGAHSDLGGSSCGDLALYGQHFFRCMACSDSQGKCQINEYATVMTNQSESCEALPCNTVSQALKGRTTPLEEDAEEAPSRFGIFPNPVSDLFYVEIPKRSSQTLRLVVRGLGGRALYSSEVSGGSLHPVRASSWPAGYYLATLFDQGRPVASEKIVVLPR